MFDVVVVAMFAVLPVLVWSIYTVRVRRRFHLHQRVQVLLGLVLLLTVALFEVDIRLDRSWWERAKQSPFHANGVLVPLLAVHVPLSVSTTVLWFITIASALRRFPQPPLPSAHSKVHRTLGWLSTILMFLTALTGWTFYWMAFVAS